MQKTNHNFVNLNKCKMYYSKKNEKQIKNKTDKF